MACAGLLLVSVLASTTLQLSDAARGNMGQPASPSGISPSVAAPRAINLSLPDKVHGPAMPSSGMEFAPISANPPPAVIPTTISFGPFRTQFGGTTGRHMHLATVKLEGVSILGGSIGGSIDSRSARITFSWPTSR
jgi:hypothetical protein